MSLSKKLSEGNFDMRAVLHVLFNDSEPITDFTASQNVHRGVIRVWWHRTSHICRYQKSFLNTVSSLHESLTPIVLAALRQTEWDQVSRALNNCTTRQREAAGSLTCRDRFAQNKASQRRLGKQTDV